MKPETLMKLNPYQLYRRVSDFEEEKPRAPWEDRITYFVFGAAFLMILRALSEIL